MKNKNSSFFAIIFCAFFILFCPARLFASVDIELPLDANLGFSEIPLDDHQNFTQFFPYFTIGPIRAQYVFDSENRWSFGLGGSVFAWPFQNFAFTASANFLLCQFKNAGSLELSNIFEPGLFMLFSDYYVVEGENSGKTVTKANCSLSLSYLLNLIYRLNNDSGFYCGLGCYVAGTKVDSSLCILYGINTTFGWRIKTGE